MLTVRKKLLAAAATAVFCFSGVVFAEQKEVYDLGEIDINTYELEENSVSARSNQLYREQFKSADMRNVADALSMMPGISSSSGVKSEKNIYIRGFNQRHVPVFIDGIPISLPYDSYVDMGKIGLYGVGKIEVQTTAPSINFGSNALGGAVNIVTRKPLEKFEGEVALEYGRNNRFISELSLGSRQEKFYIAFSGSYEDSDGFMLSSDFSDTEKEDGGERENSDYLAKNANFKFGFTPTDSSEISVGYNLIESERGLPHGVYDYSRYWRMADWDKKTYYLIAGAGKGHTKAKFRLYRDEYYNVLRSYDDATYSTQLTRKGWQSTYDDHAIGAVLSVTSSVIPKNNLSFTFQYRRDEHKSQGNYGEPWLKYEADTFYTGIEDSIALSDKLVLNLGLAYDRNKPVYAENEDGSEADDLREAISSFSPKAGLIYKYSDKTQLHASVGKTTKFPSLKDLYSTFIDGDYIENPDLEEEKAVNYEVGLRQSLGDYVTLQSNLFYSEIEDLITDGTIEVGGNLYDQKQNIGKAVYKGFEVFLNGFFMDINEFTLSYTYLDAENKSDDRTSDHIEAVPEHRLFMNHLVTLKEKFYVSSNLTLQTDQYEDNRGDWSSMGGMYLVDTKIGYKPSDRITLEAGVKNLFDRNYSYSDGYPMEGRYWFSKISLRI